MGFGATGLRDFVAPSACPSSAAPLSQGQLHPCTHHRPLQGRDGWGQARGAVMLWTWAWLASRHQGGLEEVARTHTGLHSAHQPPQPGAR